MGLFNFENRKINLFSADCMKVLNETAIALGVIASKSNTTTEDLMKYGEIGIDVFLKQSPALYGGIDNYCEDAFYFTISLGIVLGARLRYDKLSHEYVAKVINESPSEVGAAYLELVGLDDFDHPFYTEMLSKFLSLYNAHKLSDGKKEYLKRALIVLYAIGNTIALT